MRSISIVIPALNEEGGIASIVERVLAVRALLERDGWAAELIVVDDGSRDRTAAIVGHYPDARLIRHLINRGYGAAIKTGFRAGDSDYVSFLDADGTYPPESLPDLCREALAQDADVVVGSRMSGAKSDMPIMRRVGNIAFSILLSVIGNVAVRDTTSGLRVIRRSILPRLYPLPDGLQFTPAMSTRAIHENLKIIEVPVPYAERVGRSKLSVVRDGVRFSSAIVWTALAYNPVRILGMGALAAFALALIFGLYLVSLRLSGVTTLTPWQVYLVYGAALMVVAAINLFSLGAMFNYLVALFHRQPVRQGLFGRPIFTPPLDHHFGWVGAVAIVLGTLTGMGAFAASWSGWENERLWFYLLASASLVIVGIQLAIAWVIMRVLEELAQREADTQRDMSESAEADGPPAVAVMPGRAP